VKTKDSSTVAGPISTDRNHPRYPVRLLAGFLTPVTITVYWPVTNHDFVIQLDPDYVVAHVNPGTALGREGRIDEALLYSKKPFG
jgi:hypothetical protein